MRDLIKKRGDVFETIAAGSLSSADDATLKVGQIGKAPPLRLRDYVRNPGMIERVSPAAARKVAKESLAYIQTLETKIKSLEQKA